MNRTVKHNLTRKF